MTHTLTAVHSQRADLPWGRGSLAGSLSFFAFLPVITSFREGTLLELTAARAHVPTAVLALALLALVLHLCWTARSRRGIQRWAAGGYTISVVISAILGYVTLSYLLTI